MKKGWKKPELNILLKGTPEERVLWACKNASGSGDYATGGPLSYMCGVNLNDHTYCNAENPS